MMHCLLFLFAKLPRIGNKVNAIDLMNAWLHSFLVYVWTEENCFFSCWHGDWLFSNQVWFLLLHFGGVVCLVSCTVVPLSYYRFTYCSWNACVVPNHGKKVAYNLVLYIFFFWEWNLVLYILAWFYCYIGYSSFRLNAKGRFMWFSVESRQHCKVEEERRR